MSLAGAAFTRSRILLAAKKNVPQQYKNWWKKVRPVQAEITQTLASNEQNILLPWIKTFPKKVVQRVPVYMWPIGTAFFVYATCAFTDGVDQAEDLEHRF